MLTRIEGRTGRIGNIGLATSFYTSRDEDLAPGLVKTLLETHQVIPDFLEEFIPEGFTADGQTGDVNTLKFDADSDNGEDAGDESAEAGAAASGGWGAPAATPVDSTTAGGWGAAPASQPAQPANNWGAQPAVTAQPTILPPGPPANSWSASAPAAPAANDGWGVPAAKPSW